MSVTPYQYKITLGEIHDADTLWVTIDLGFRLSKQTKIRLASVNAPELATDAGKAALAAVKAFVADHPGQWLAKTYGSGEDKYGRWLADVFAPDGTNLSSWLLMSGYAVPMKG